MKLFVSYQMFINPSGLINPGGLKRIVEAHGLASKLLK